MTTTARFAYVGSRTNAMRKARGEGITVWSIGDGKSDWERLQTVDIDDPSFLAFDSEKRFVYASQGDGSNVRAFARDGQTGLLTFLNQQPSLGLNGAHIAVDPTDRFVVVANHLTGEGFVSNLAVFPILPDGSLGEIADMRPIEGKPGPNRKEQPFAKPHQVQFSPDGRFMTMADKGLDEVFVFALDDAGKLHLAQDPPIRARWGAAPRHMAFHPTGCWLYILNEIDSTIVTATVDPASGHLTPFQIVHSMSDEWTSFSSSSHIVASPDGRFVYASNRGQDTVGVFEVDQQTGRLTARQFAKTGGRIPRYFAFTPEHRDLFVANEWSDLVAHFDVGEDGLLSGGRTVAQTGTPTCIVLA